VQSLPWVRAALPLSQRERGLFRAILAMDEGCPSPSPFGRGVGVRASDRTISITCLLAHRYPTYKNEELSRRFPSPYPSPKGRGNCAVQSLAWVRVVLLPLPWERVGVRASDRTISITCLLAHRYPTYKNEELSRRFPSPYPSPKGRGNCSEQSLAWERELSGAIPGMGEGTVVCNPCHGCGLPFSLSPWERVGVRASDRRGPHAAYGLRVALSRVSSGYTAAMTTSS
jgi:hypothetical protein